MTFETAENRYQRDPVFKGLVDVMYSHIDALRLTPTEMREAAMLACIKFEQRHPSPVMLRDMHAQFLDSISGARGESE
jgi:hypothetical protein